MRRTSSCTARALSSSSGGLLAPAASCAASRALSSSSAGLLAPAASCAASRAFSSSSGGPPKIHEDIDSSAVRSKAMRKRLQAEEAARAPALQAPPPPPPSVEQQYRGAEPQQGPPMSFGGHMLSSALSGFAVALGMIFVFGFLKMVGMEGEKGRAGGGGGGGDGARVQKRQQQDAGRHFDDDEHSEGKAVDAEASGLGSGWQLENEGGDGAANDGGRSRRGGGGTDGWEGRDAAGGGGSSTASSAARAMR